jgi:hypothetical protein
MPGWGDRDELHALLDVRERLKLGAAEQPPLPGFDGRTVGGGICGQRINVILVSSGPYGSWQNINRH